MLQIQGNVIFWVILLVILLLVGYMFLSQNKSLFAKAETLVSPLNQTEKSSTEESSESITYRSLDVDPADPPETIIYKLFRNFDPYFLNETVNNKVFYNSFILDLKGSSVVKTNLINKVTEGIRDFSSSDPSYQIGNAQPPSCGSVGSSNLITYENGCWDSSLDSQPNPCKIYVKGGSSGNFNGRVKIKVVWYLGSIVRSKRIINTIVTLCDG